MGDIFTDGCGIIGAVDTVMGPGKSKPHGAERSTGIGCFVDDVKRADRRLCKHFADRDRIDFYKPTVLSECQRMTG